VTIVPHWSGLIAAVTLRLLHLLFQQVLGLVLLMAILNGTKVHDSDLPFTIFSAARPDFHHLGVHRARARGRRPHRRPSGVGYRRDPQLFLHDGDTINVEIDG
jgi:hypothetical protein